MTFPGYVLPKPCVYNIFMLHSLPGSQIFGVLAPERTVSCWYYVAPGLTTHLRGPPSSSSSSWNLLLGGFPIKTPQRDTLTPAISDAGSSTKLSHQLYNFFPSFHYLSFKESFHPYLRPKGCIKADLLPVLRASTATSLSSQLVPKAVV